MAAKKTKKTAPKSKAKTGKSNQHCKKCGKPGHNSRRHKAKAPVKKPAKK